MRREPDYFLSNSGLSKDQLKPFARNSRNASILASAGSGKTKTLVHLATADLLSDVPPENIVVFTFTEKAADELLARIHGLMVKYFPKIDLTGMYIGTIHGWCFQYLLKQREYYNFSPVDELHMDALVSRLYDTLQLEKIYGLSYPQGVSVFLKDLEVFYNEHLPFSEIPPSIRLVIKKFLQILVQSRLLPFGSMIRTATEQLEKTGPLSGLEAIYVDEYQDVNPAQVALVKAMISPKAKMIVVGDDLQCIYQWRGSDVSRILSFVTEFSDSAIFRLTENFRSRPEVVNLSNDVAKKIALRDQKKLMVPARTKGHCPSVHWISLETDEAQIRAVVSLVKNLEAKKIPYDQIAILLRSVNSYGRPFMESLRLNGIPVVCPMLGKAGGFIDEVSLPIFNWLRKEPKEPKNEIEEREMEQEAGVLWSNIMPWAKSKENVFWTALSDWNDSITNKNSLAYDIRGRFYDFLDKCQIQIKSSDSDLMVGLGITSQVIRSVEEIHRRRIPGENRRSPRGIISEVYFALRRKRPDFGESVPVQEVAKGVTITTVHQAKGLEWAVVIMPMLINRRFPVPTSHHGTSFPDQIASRYGTTIDDERRLFYVAVTRARERLFLIDPLGSNPKKRSIFLKELESEGYKPKNITSLPQQTWVISKKDLEPKDIPPLRIGLSDLLLYLECPFQFGLRRIAGVQPSIGDDLGFGKSLHEVIQRRLESKKPWNSKDLDTNLKEHVFLPYTSDAGEEKARMAIGNRIQGLENTGLFDKGNVLAEIPVEAILKNGVIYGVIDCLQADDKGGIVIRDWKSNIHEEFSRRYDLQLQFYAWTLRSRGLNLNKAEVVDVAQSASQKKLVVKGIDIGESTIKSMIQLFESALKGICEGIFDPKASMQTCKFCDVNRICGERRLS